MIKQPRIAVFFDSEDTEYRMRKRMYNFDMTDASYFVDNQMDLDIDYGNIVISADVEDILQLGKRIIELTVGANLSDQHLKLLGEALDDLCIGYAKLGEANG